MALYNYFNKLGYVNYNGELANNIITSIRFKDAVAPFLNYFYPYVVKEGERPDTIAHFYYGDSRYAWVILLCNNILDPYFEWPLSQNQLDAFLIKKYGSLVIASEKILCYRNNWYVDDSVLSTSTFQALPASRKKYWNPIVGYNNVVSSYERKKIDYTVETNRVVQLNLTPNSNNLLIGEIVSQSSTNSTGCIKAILPNAIIVNNITGAFTTSGALLGLTSNASKTITSTTTLSTPIPEEEVIYWSPVTAYDYETELNESRKSIKLLDSRYLNVVEDKMNELLL